MFDDQDEARKSFEDIQKMPYKIFYFNLLKE